jgi:tetratricopeptide (TPR) repeat protein
MLTGAPPFTGNRVFDILTKQVTDIPAPLPTRRPGVPLWMEAAVAKMLAKDPENRFATTTRMVEALRRGLETGEVMEDEIARRRESIPPPSVSRVMQKMGMSAPADRERDIPRDLPPLPPAPTVAEPVVQAAAAPTERRRTGTPEVGVPVVPVQPAVAGVVEQKYETTDKLAKPVKAPLIELSAPAGRAKRASSHGIGESSAAWYEEGERAAAELHHDDDFEDSDKKKQRARKLISPSITDLSMYDAPASNRRGLVLFALLGVLVIGGGLAFALTRGGDDTKKPQPLAAPPIAAVITSDAAPSQMIDTVVDAGVAVTAPADAATQVAVAPSHPTPPAPPTHPIVATSHPTTGTGSHDHDRTHNGPGFDFGVDDSSRRHTPPPPAGTGSGSTTVTPTGTGSASSGVSGDGPQDPYNPGGVSDPGDAASADKKAEFYANLGAQQLASSDTAGAAASFKKAIELDPKNVAAVSGMGEIALRQGLFGDAIAHLKKAARLAPKSSNVYTLLGEAYLNSGNNSVAAENFKKALQLDPDNKRAREGYDEASSKVPPPTDD